MVKRMSWKTYLGVSVPCGLVTAVDVGLSNLSLVRISITFFTMVKSSAPIWCLMSAFFFGLEKITFNLIMVGLLITGGEILTAFGEVEFDSIGFMLCTGAAICGGLRWTLVQFKLQKLDPPLAGPVVTMRVLSSTMFISMLMLSFILEQPWKSLGPKKGDYFIDFEHGMKTISLGLIGAVIAIAMVLCEFWLILKSNAIVLMIGGVIKEMITIFVGVTLFGDNLNLINLSGIAVVFLGVVLYKFTLYFSRLEKENMSSDAQDKTHFSRISSLDDYEDEPIRAKRSRHKNSDPDLALSFKIDDEDIDEDILMEMNGNGLSPLRRTNGTAFEVDEEEEDILRIV